MSDAARDDVIHRLGHAFASAETAEELAGGAARWAREILEDPEADVRVCVKDVSARLRTVRTGDHGTGAAGGRRGSVRRRAAFESKRVAVWQMKGDVADEPSRAIAFLPAVCRGEAFGVISIVSSLERLRDRLPSLLVVASQAGIALRAIRRRQELERIVGALSGIADLTVDLLRSREPEAVARVGARFIGLRLGLPVAAWVVQRDGRYALSGSRNLGPADRHALGFEYGAAFADGTHPGFGDGLEGRFAEIVGGPVSPLDAGAVRLLVGRVPPAADELLVTLGSLLREALHGWDDKLHLVPRERLHLGLAWTAHEVRRPLLGARATVDTLLFGSDQDVAARELLRRTSRELGEAAKMVDGLLRWTVGTGSLKRRSVDASRVVREAVASACHSPAERDRVALDGPASLLVRADVRHLRQAIGNLVRNALDYSPKDAEVDVAVRPGKASVVVSVRDHGPGIPREERDAIFDPFVRGRAADEVRGSGLGLFIARRVVEAHDGRLLLRSGPGGTTFSAVLPRAGSAARLLSAS
ncbi:MAG TPA: HAMP domain-containing sensor histidine kinase [Actinomycetota bacterium]